MPTVSVDTFFACSLMVLLVLFAMAGASKLLYPTINNVADAHVDKRYGEISKYLLLNSGTPSNWGQNWQVIPETFGLAEVNPDSSYKLDIDKVSRLNSENIYAISYAQIFTALKMPDVSLRMEIEPVFNVAINLTATLEEAKETVYQFEILTQRCGVLVSVELKCYVVAENYLNSTYVNVSNGRTYLNITLSNNVSGPALLIALAMSTSNTKIVSFNAYAFAHSSLEPKPKGAFLRLSPLNYNLNVSFVYHEISLLKAYALTFNYSSILTQTAGTNQSAAFEIPHFLDSSPTLIVVTGWNSTSFFTEWTAYPQIPLQAGANFADSNTLSSVFAYTYLVTIGSTIYECRVWLGGLRE